MRPDSKRWVDVTPSECAHERGGLAAVREAFLTLIPTVRGATSPSQPATGACTRSTCLFIGPSGLHLVELNTGKAKSPETARHGGGTGTQPTTRAF